MRKLASFLMLAIVAVACGSPAEPSPPPDANQPAGTTSVEGVDGATGTADPLVGEWIQTFSCEDEFAAVDPAAVDGYKEWARFSREAWGGSKDDPCRGSTGELTRIVRFESGQVLIFDPPNLELGLNAAYELQDGTFTANDGGQNIPGTFTFRFEIVGDELTVELVGPGAKDPWTVSAWEATPFIRAS